MNVRESSPSLSSSQEEMAHLLMEKTMINNQKRLDIALNNPRPYVPFYIALILAMGNAADAVEIMSVGFIMSSITNLTSKDKEFLSAAVFLGMLFGGIVGGQLSDIIGRRKGLLWSLGLNGVAGLLSAASPGVSVLIVLRIVAGLGIG